MTYKGAIDEVKSLANNSLMPVIFKPSLKKIVETLEKERPKELTLSEVETYANEHNYVLWTDEMSEKALALIKADRERPKGEWIPVSERVPEIGQRVIATIETLDGLQVRETIYDKYGFLCGHGIAWQPLPEPYKAESEDI